MIHVFFRPCFGDAFGNKKVTTAGLLGLLRLWLRVPWLRNAPQVLVSMAKNIAMAFSALVGKDPVTSHSYGKWSIYG